MPQILWSPLALEKINYSLLGEVNIIKKNIGQIISSIFIHKFIVLQGGKRPVLPTRIPMPPKKGAMVGKKSRPDEYLTSLSIKFDYDSLL